MGQRKKWTLQEKLSILEEASTGDVVLTCRKHGVSSGTYYNWKKKFELNGEQGLTIYSERKDPALKKADEQIRILRKLLADKEIELEMQREMLKKKFGTSDPRKI